MFRRNVIWLSTEYIVFCLRLQYSLWELWFRKIVVSVYDEDVQITAIDAHSSPTKNRISYAEMTQSVGLEMMLNFYTADIIISCLTKVHRTLQEEVASMTCC
jgi:hypothetical protein